MSLKKISKLNDYSDLADARIITKNLVYVIGLSGSIANRELLIKKDYFGQYGSIVKIVVNKNKAYNQNSPKGPSYSAYITYSKPYEASIAILSLDNVIVDEHLIRASFGTTKYCTFFLKHIECTNKDCLFLHKWAEDSDIICREDLNSNKNIFYDQQIYALKIADIFNSEIKKRLLQKKGKTGLPSPDTIYNKDVVKEYELTMQTQKQKITKKYEEDNNKINQSNPISTNHIASPQNLKIQQINEINQIKERNSLTPTNHYSETTSTSSRDDFVCEDRQISCNTPFLIPSEIKKEPTNIFINKSESRFNFQQTNNQENVEIPHFIQQLINKRMSRHKLIKYIPSIEDITYSDKVLEQEFFNNNSWAKFIVENKEKLNIKNTSKDEFIQDFDYINNLVFSKCGSQTNQKQRHSIINK